MNSFNRTEGHFISCIANAWLLCTGKSHSYCKPSVRVSIVNGRNLVNVKYVFVKIPEFVMLFSVSTLLTPWRHALQPRLQVSLESPPECLSHPSVTWQPIILNKPSSILKEQVLRKRLSDLVAFHCCEQTMRPQFHSKLTGQHWPLCTSWFSSFSMLKKTYRIISQRTCFPLRWTPYSFPWAFVLGYPNPVLQSPAGFSVPWAETLPPKKVGRQVKVCLPGSW